MSLHALALVCGCSTPLERDCRVLTPILDDLSAAARLSFDGRHDLADVEQARAHSSREAAARLEATSLKTAALAPVVATAAQALESHARSAERVEEAIRALGLRNASSPAAPSARLAGMFGPERGGLTKLEDDVKILLQRCWTITGESADGGPECQLWEALVQHTLAPDANATVTTHFAARLQELAVIHSTDARSEAALRHVETLARDLVAELEHLMPNGPATGAIEKLRALAMAFDAERSTAALVTQSSAAIRRQCTPGP